VNEDFKAVLGGDTVGVFCFGNRGYFPVYRAINLPINRYNGTAVTENPVRKNRVGNIIQDTAVPLSGEQIL